MDPQVPPQNEFEPTSNKPNRLVGLLRSSRKQVLAIVVVLVLVIVGVLALTSKKPTPAPAPTKQTTQQETVLVSVTKDGFVPATINIKKGTKVTWTNNSELPSHIASDPHPTNDILPELDSTEPLNKGDSYSFTFEKSGTFTYHDHLNPFKYAGTVVVE